MRSGPAPRGIPVLRAALRPLKVIVVIRLDAAANAYAPAEEGGDGASGFGLRRRGRGLLRGVGFLRAHNQEGGYNNHHCSHDSTDQQVSIILHSPSSPALFSCSFGGGRTPLIASLNTTNGALFPSPSRPPEPTQSLTICYRMAARTLPNSAPPQAAMIPAISSSAQGLMTATLRLEASARSLAGATRAPNGQRNYVLVPADRLAVASPAARPQAGLARPVTISAPAWLAGNDSGAQEGAEMTGAILEHMDAAHSFKANAQTFSVAQDMVKKLFDLVD